MYATATLSVSAYVLQLTLARAKRSEIVDAGGAQHELDTCCGCLLPHGGIPEIVLGHSIAREQQTRVSRIYPPRALLW
jgi:hypothetical protein